MGPSGPSRQRPGLDPPVHITPVLLGPARDALDRLVCPGRGLGQTVCPHHPGLSIGPTRTTSGCPNGGRTVPVTSPLLFRTWVLGTPSCSNPYWFCDGSSRGVTAPPVHPNYPVHWINLPWVQSRGALAASWSHGARSGVLGVCTPLCT